MDKLFKFLNRLFGSRSFRLFLFLLVVFIIGQNKFRSAIKFIDVGKVEKIAGKVVWKKIGPNRKANVTDVIGGEKTLNREQGTTMEYRQVSPAKKRLIPDAHIEKIEERQTKKKEEFRNITNIFLKLKMVEEDYVERLKNKQINHSRVSKYGDFVYYSTKTSFKDKSYDSYADSKNSTNHFFMRLKKGDFLSEKLVGKKVGQVISYGYVDLIAGLPEENRKVIVESMKYTMNKINKQYKKGDIKLPEAKDLLYSVAILDFIADKTVKNLALESNMPQKLPIEKQRTDKSGEIKNTKPETAAEDPAKNTGVKSVQPREEENIGKSTDTKNR
ncbi:MAG: hypothetical protein LBB13_01310 [Rickettsiales bacterium]|jgi:hypothetical protein|nr:hypothetical protein [Rickettsiales bacterium]